MTHCKSQVGGNVLPSQREQMKREFHFIGRAYICYNGGFRHEHLRESDYRNCQEVENKRQHTTSVKEKGLQKAAGETRIEEDLRILQEKNKSAEIAIRAAKVNHEINIETKQLEMKKQDKDKWLEEKRIKVKEDNARTVNTFFEMLKNNQFKLYSNGPPNKKEHNSPLSDDGESSTEIDSDVLKHIASVVTAIKKE